MPGPTAASDFTRQPTYRAAVAYVNKLRDEEGLPALLFLPRAEGCRHPFEVAVPSMIGQRYGHALMPWERGRRTVKTPDAVRRFILDYDAGHYPDLLPLPGVPCDAASHRPSCPQSRFARLRSAEGV